MKMLVLLFILASCTSKNLSKSSIEKNLDFNKDYNLIEFKQLLKIYNDKKDFPNIDN